MAGSATDLQQDPLQGVALDFALLAGIVREQLAGLHAEVLLFGSQARGDARPRSDIDIAIRADQALPHAKLVELRAALEESNLVRRVDVVDWWAASPAMRQTVLREGIPWPK